MMGPTLLACFPKTNSHVATNMCDTDGGTWPQIACIFQNKNQSH
jgi:hypothetical protein